MTILFYQVEHLFLLSLYSYIMHNLLKTMINLNYRESLFNFSFSLSLSIMHFGTLHHFSVNVPRILSLTPFG
jgi:hypothetical protein